MKPHTIRPGMDYTTGGRDFAIIDAKGRIIGEAFDFVGPGERADAKGNARLFANAHVYLALLERMVETCMEDDAEDIRSMTLWDAVHEAQDLIVAAKGGKS